MHSVVRKAAANLNLKRGRVTAGHSGHEVAFSLAGMMSRSAQ
jgi:hypothetical protein